MKRNSARFDRSLADEVYRIVQNAQSLIWQIRTIYHCRPLLGYIFHNTYLVSTEAKSWGPDKIFQICQLLQNCLSWKIKFESTVISQFVPSKNFQQYSKKGHSVQWRIQDFPEEGALTPKEGALTYYLVNYSRKLHENEEILGQRGARGTRAPLRSATAVLLPNSWMLFFYNLTGKRLLLKLCPFIILGLRDFIPILNDRSPHSAGYESFSSLHGRAARWIYTQNNTRIINLQTLPVKIKKEDTQGRLQREPKAVTDPGIEVT